MRKLTGIAALAAATLLANPAWAGSADGKLQIKVLGTAVLPDGKITKKTTDLIGLPATTQTRADDNFVPTLAVEYFAAPNFSVETICCLTEHKVDATAGVAGRIVDHVLILPATVTLKYHLPMGPVKPYLGVGPTLFLIMGEKPGATAKAVGATSVHMSNELGVALQGGVDIAIGDNGLGFSLDAKKYFVNTTATFRTAAGTAALVTEHKLDPWVLSAGVAYRF